MTARQRLLTPTTTKLTKPLLDVTQIAKAVILEIDPEGHGIDFLAFKGAVDKMPDFLFNFGMPT